MAEVQPSIEKNDGYIIIPCLTDINDLRKIHEETYTLNLEIRKRKMRPLDPISHKRRQRRLLRKWQKAINEATVGKEPEVKVRNVVDDEGPPSDFTYIIKSIPSANVQHSFDPHYLVGCDCTPPKRCTKSSCNCPANSGGDFAYDVHGRVTIDPGRPIYECNSRCKCTKTCRNRVVQRGRSVKVSIFKTDNGRGWGVKTLEFINCNQFVTEYVGEIICSEEAEQRGRLYDNRGQTYLFDLDYNDGDCLYTIDAYRYGNVSHFINHSCDPNLSVYGVWVDTLDPQLPRIALFAKRDIPAGQELTFDYLMTAGESGGVGQSPANIRTTPKKNSRMKCFCGAANCRGFLF